MSEDTAEFVQVPRRLLVETMIALQAASVIGQRSCRPGDGLDYGNHDRLIRELQQITDWSGISEYGDGGVMKNASTVKTTSTWVCDLCEATDDSPSGLPPLWRQANVWPSGANDFDLFDLCPKCSEPFVKAVGRRLRAAREAISGSSDV